MALVRPTRAKLYATCGRRDPAFFVQQAATFRLVVNKTTAQTIGVTLPVTLLLQANHVID